MSKNRALTLTLINLGIGVFFATMQGGGTCAGIFIVAAIIFGFVWFSKSEYERRLPQITLEAHASELKNQHLYSTTPPMQSSASKQMLVEPTDD